jgi:hypothetical protein
VTLTIYHDVEVARQTVLRRSLFDDVEVAPALQASLDRAYGPGTTPAQVVEHIIAGVRAEGDTALRRYSREIEGVELGSGGSDSGRRGA